jgi:hypothetical protein
MSRNVLFVLMLGTGVGLADYRLAAGQTKTEPAQAKTDAAQKETGEAQRQTEQVKTEGAERPAEEAQAPAEGDAKLTSTPGAKALGISILGNQEAPTSLVIVPWKTSELGNSLGMSPMLDDSRQPVDEEVFMRALRYYEIRSGTTRPDGATAGGRDAAARSDAAQSTATRRR